MGEQVKKPMGVLALIISSWATIQPRVRDAAVAEHLFSWVQTKNVMGVYTGYGRDPNKLCRHIPRFASDASADYQVLVKARTWDDEQYDKFEEELNYIIQRERGFSSITRGYEPGDYSRAALTVVSKNVQAVNP